MEDGRRNTVLLTACAVAIYALSAGIRSDYGILVEPVCLNSGLSYASVSLILGIGQLVFGIMQPLSGYLALKRSYRSVLLSGVVLILSGVLLIPFSHSFVMLLLSWGLLLPCGTAALSFGVIMGAVTPKISSSGVAAASGLVSASSGIGGALLAPLLQLLLLSAGLIGAMSFLGVPALLLLPVCLFITRGEVRVEEGRADTEGLLTILSGALHCRDYWFLLFGFFSCGFHMVLIETHLVGEITLSGFSRETASAAIAASGIIAIIGCVISGWLCGSYQMKNVLSLIYLLRSVMVLLFLLLPKTPVTVLGFSALVGLVGSATVPPTSGITERLFGVRRYATLFGIVFLSHQAGGFLSSYLGGLCLSLTGSYQLIWCADMLLTLCAAIVSFRIRRT